MSLWFDNNINTIRNATVAESKPTVLLWKQMFSWKSLSIKLLGMSFADHIVPFTEIKGSLVHFPTQSAMKPKRDYH